MSEKVTVLKFDNCTMTVRRPDLTLKEYERHFERLKKATADFLRQVEKEMWENIVKNT